MPEWIVAVAVPVFSLFRCEWKPLIRRNELFQKAQLLRCSKVNTANIVALLVVTARYATAILGTGDRRIEVAGGNMIQSRVSSELDACSNPYPVSP